MRKRNLKIIGWGPIVAALVPLALFEYLRGFAGTDPILRVPRQHFVIVSVASLLAGLIAGAVGLAARRQRNIEASFLAMAFMSLGFLFSIHGLATPGFLLPPSPLPGVMAQLSILPAAAWLLLSSSPSDLRPVAWLCRCQRLLIPFWGACLLAIGAASLVFPHAWGHVPLNLPPLVWPMAAAIIVMLLVAAARYWYSYTYSRFPQRADLRPVVPRCLAAGAGARLHRAGGWPKVRSGGGAGLARAPCHPHRVFRATARARRRSPLSSRSAQVRVTRRIEVLLDPPAAMAARPRAYPAGATAASTPGANASSSARAVSSEVTSGTCSSTAARRRAKPARSGR